MSDRTGDAHVVELTARVYGAQHQPAAAHVAAPDEMDREHQSIAENGEQQVDVLAGGNASKQHDLAVRTDGRQDRPGALLERLAVRGI